MKSWKTTVAGLAVGVVTVLAVMGIIDEHQAEAIGGVLLTFGLWVAKDGNVSGSNSSKK